MSNTPTTNNHQEEIDLGYLLNKVNQVFKKAVKLFFELIGFFIKFWIIVLALLVIAIAYGYYKDYNTKTVYDNKAIVIPNFESVDYMYAKVDALNAKIESRDTVFLKQVLDTNHRKLRKIELEPIVDIYNFISKSRENIDIFRIFVQSQELDEYIEEYSNSKYYKYHTLNLRIRDEESAELIFGKVLEFLNDNEHYSSYGATHRKNLEFQIKEYDNMITQFDSLIASMSRNNIPNQGVAMFDYTNLHLLFERKRDMMKEKLEVEKKLTDYEETIKLVDVEYNLETEARLSSKIKYPIFVFIGIILLFFAQYTLSWLRKIANEN